MSTITIVPTESTDLALTDDTTALLKSLYSGRGKVTDTEVSALVHVLTKSDVTVTTADALTKAADTAVQDARAMLVAARAESTKVRQAAGEARVTFGRVALALTTKDIRGEATMTGQGFAEAVGVSGAYVSQVVSVARAARRLGTTSPTAWADLTAARKVGAGALASVVSSALDTATKRTLDKAPEGVGTPVRATVSEVSAARAVVSPVPSAPSDAVTLASVVKSLTALDTKVTGQVLTGTEAERDKVLSLLDILANVIRTADVQA